MHPALVSAALCGIKSSSRAVPEHFTSGKRSSGDSGTGAVDLFVFVIVVAVVAVVAVVVIVVLSSSTWTFFHRRVTIRSIVAALLQFGFGLSLSLSFLLYSFQIQVFKSYFYPRQFINNVPKSINYELFHS